ncbi:MAG: NAD(P)H-dependent oxidoreductase subunit E, partial [candidate division Zixibacteria bacterium]|nr:NAD(P)H-dependent oxidoreductase subunit E [candidate division Zixibacteria bacterium]
MSVDKLPELLSGYAGEEGEFIPLLQAVQRQYGYISEEAVGSIAPFLKISENQIYGVASYYSQL